ncbi:MAG: hypothetical protein ACTSXY_12395 [Promethearchaeota archaeon]
MASQTYQATEQLNFKIPFEVNGSVPSASAVCNLSLEYPNGTYLKRNVSMENLLNGDFNYTLLSTELKDIGFYNWRAFCCDGTKCAAGYGSFEITPSGSDAINSGEGMTLVLSIVSILVIASLFFIFSFKVNAFPIKVILMGLSLVLFIIVISFTMVTFGQILGGYSALIEGYTAFFWVAGFMLLLVFIFLMLVLFKNAIELFKIKRGLA